MLRGGVQGAPSSEELLFARKHQPWAAPALAGAWEGDGNDPQRQEEEHSSSGRPADKRQAV